MADSNRRIYNHYKRAGYLSVPGFYDREGRDNRCKICNWYNEGGSERICLNCGDRYRKAHKANKEIHGISVRLLSREEWQVFEAIARQMLAHETPFATLEEYAEECAEHIKESEEKRKTMVTDQQRIDKLLYG